MAQVEARKGWTLSSQVQAATIFGASGKSGESTAACALGLRHVAQNVLVRRPLAAVEMPALQVRVQPSLIALHRLLGMRRVPRFPYVIRPLRATRMDG
jgi:hypothetical protein